MKGIPMFRLTRLNRTAVLLGAGTLVAGAALLGAARANAAVGTQPGALVITPATGTTTASGLTYRTTTACPGGHQGSGVVRLVDPGTGATANASQVKNSVTAPFSGSLNATFAQLAGVFPDVKGHTAELAVYCFPSPSAVGTPIAVQDTFVTINAAGNHYSISSNGGTTAAATESPAPAGGDTIPIGVTVTSATPAATSATPAATSANPAAAPATGGGTGPGSNLALAATGAAVVLAGGGLILLAGQRRRQGAG